MATSSGRMINCLDNVDFINTSSFKGDGKLSKKIMPAAHEPQLYSAGSNYVP